MNNFNVREPITYDHIQQLETSNFSGICRQVSRSRDSGVQFVSYKRSCNDKYNAWCIIDELLRCSVLFAARRGAGTKMYATFFSLLDDPLSILRSDTVPLTWTCWTRSPRRPGSEWSGTLGSWSSSVDGGGKHATVLFICVRGQNGSLGRFPFNLSLQIILCRWDKNKTCYKLRGSITLEYKWVRHLPY